MSKALYIIGNGFDKAHGLKTSYWDFRTYLESTHWEFLQAFEKLYGFEPLDDLDPYVPEGAKLRWEKMLQGELWSRLEDNMGHPNIAQMENFSDCIVDDLDLDSGNVGIRDTLDEYWRREYGFIKKLQGYIKEWIESLDTTKIKPRKKVLIKSTDYFFSFNYTDTLESVYKITDVFHVHGGIDSICDREPIMGHCNREQIKEYREKAVEADNLWDEGAASIDDAIADYLEGTYKDTAQIIWFCDYFWHRLSDINHVTIIGWSAGSVDMPYLEKIVACIPKHTKWTVYFYNPNEKGALEKALKLCGVNTKDIELLQSDTYWDC